MQGAITYPKGFLAAGVRAGIKQKGADMALIVSERSASAAGVFTTNLFKAAPVIVSRSRLPRGTARAIIANAGNANACTGEQGKRDASEMSRLVAKAIGVTEDDVLVASTGVIGHTLPMDKICAGIADAAVSLSVEGGADAARAIMTTDTRPKEAAVEIEIGGAKVRVGGIAKGAGMIQPNVATMLTFITTDAAISPTALQRCLASSADQSFNCVTVDGDTSTNDTVIILANGMAGNRMIDAAGSDTDAFQAGLDEVTRDLAKQIAADGEGATKLIEIIVEGAGSYDKCKRIAMTIANSPLVKTAAFGRDPNWGRVVAAAGRSGVEFDPGDTSLRMGEFLLFDHGEPVLFDAEKASQYLAGNEIVMWLTVGDSSHMATVWTCDFSYDYVKINAEYHT